MTDPLPTKNLAICKRTLKLHLYVSSESECSSQKIQNLLNLSPWDWKLSIWRQFLLHSRNSSSQKLHSGVNTPYHLKMSYLTVHLYEWSPLFPRQASLNSCIFDSPRPPRKRRRAMPILMMTWAEFLAYTRDFRRKKKKLFAPCVNSCESEEGEKFFCEEEKSLPPLSETRLHCYRSWDRSHRSLRDPQSQDVYLAPGVPLDVPICDKGENSGGTPGTTKTPDTYRWGRAKNPLFVLLSLFNTGFFPLFAFQEGQKVAQNPPQKPSSKRAKSC